MTQDARTWLDAVTQDAGGAAPATNKPPVEFPELVNPKQLTPEQMSQGPEYQPPVNTWLDAVTQGYEPPTKEYLKAGAKGALGTVLGGVADIVETPSVATRYRGYEGMVGRPMTLGGAIAGGLRGLADSLRTPDVERAPPSLLKFATQDVPQAVASGGTFLAGAGLLEAAGVPPVVGVAGLGAAQQGTSAYNEARAMGASGADAWTAFVANSIVGTSESLPIAGQLGRILGRADKLSGGLLHTMLAEGGEEFLQESGQQLAGNWIAASLVGYDQDRELMDGVLRSGAAGALAGAFQSALATKYGKAREMAMVGKDIADRVVPPGTEIPEEQPAVDLTGGGPSFAEQEAAQAGVAGPPITQRKQEVELHPEDAKAAQAFSKEAEYRGRFYAPSSEADQAATQIASESGRRLYFYDQPEGPQGATQGGAIFLNLDQPSGSKVEWVLNHEMAHAIYTERPEVAKGLARAVLSFPELASRARQEFASREGLDKLSDADLQKALESRLGKEETTAYAVELLGALPRAAAKNPEAAYKAAAADPGFWRGMLDGILRFFQRFGIAKGKEEAGRRVAREWVEKYSDQPWHKEVDPQKLAQIAINAANALGTLRTDILVNAPKEITHALPSIASPTSQEREGERKAEEAAALQARRNARVQGLHLRRHDEEQRLGRQRRPVRLGSPEQPAGLLGPGRESAAVEAERRARRRLRPKATEPTAVTELEDVVRVPTQPNQPRFVHPLLKTPLPELHRMLSDERHREEVFTRPILERAGWTPERIKNFLRTRSIGRESQDPHEKAIAHDVILKMKRTLSPEVRAELERTETGHPIEEIEAAISQRRAGSKKKARELGAQLRFSKPPKERAKPDRLGFYSALEDVILQKMGGKASAHEVVSLISNAGVKQEEMEWTGIKEFLAGKTTVTKQEVLDFIRANDVGLTETELTDAPESVPTAPQPGYVMRRVDDEVIDDVREFANENSDADLVGSYQERLGDWVLFAKSDEDNTLIEDPYAAVFANRDLSERDAMRAMVADIEDIGLNRHDVFEYDDEGGGETEGGVQYENYVLPGPHSNYRELLLHLPMSPEAAGTTEDRRREAGLTFEAPHFRPHETNLLAHMRVDEREPVGEKKKMLFSEEFQSDWHQQGGEKGYLTQEKSDQRAAAVARKRLAFDRTERLAREVYDRWSEKQWFTLPGGVGRPNMNDAEEVHAALLAGINEINTTTAEGKQWWKDQAEIRAVIDEANEATRLENAEFRHEPVPDAPFKQWHELAMKRLIAYAVQHDADMIGWTTGRQQIERWSGHMRQAVEEIHAYRGTAEEVANGVRKEDEVTIQARKGGRNVFSATFPLEGQAEVPGYGKASLDEVVGREVAEQIRKSPLALTVIKGDDLVVGGHFHRELYDHKLVKVANAIGKKFGVQVRKVAVDTGHEVRTGSLREDQPRTRMQEGQAEVWAMDIPPEMAKVVQDVGLARFSKRKKPMTSAERAALSRRVAPMKEAAGQAFEEGEETKVGGKPSRLAVTTESEEHRAFQRGVRATLYDEKDIQHIEDVETKAEAILEENRPLAAAGIMLKIRSGEALNSVETVMADRLWQDAFTTWMRTKKNADFLKAAELYTAYDLGRQEAGRALSVIRDALKSPREKVMEAVAEPTKETKRQMKRLRKLRKSLPAGDPRINTLEARIERLLQKESRRVQQTFKELERAGINPDLITEGYFNQPGVYKRFAQAIANGKGTWQDGFTEWILAGLTSNPASQVANITGNVAHTAYTIIARRMVEATVNMVVKDANSPTWGENAAFMRATLPALTKAARAFLMAYRADLPVYELELHARGVPGTSLAGKWSESQHLGSNLPWPLRLLRYPSLTSLMAFDEFFKAYVSEATATAQAWRQATREKAANKEARVAELMADPAFWRTARGTEEGQGLAEARKATFQDFNSPLLNGINNLLNEVDGYARFPVTRLFIPFRNTPFRIFQVGLDMPLHPLVALHRLVRGEYKGNPRLAVKDIAQTAMSLGLTLAILSMIDDPDDPDRPFITGSRSRNPGKAANQQAVAPPSSIKVGGDYYSYARIEPFATGLATIVDLANAAKKAADEPSETGPVISAIGSMASSVADQAGDKTFLQGIGDIMELVQEPDSNKAKRLLRDTITTPFIPRIIPGVIRAGDEFVRPDTLRKYEDKGEWTTAAESAWRKNLPTSGNVPPPKYDWLGRPIKSDGRNYIARLLSPTKITQEGEDVSRLDILIKRWNTKVETGEVTGEKADVYYPKPPDYWFTRNKQRHYWSPGEYEALQRDAGQMAAKRLEQRHLDWQSPTSADIDAIRSEIGRARRRLVDSLYRKRKAP